MKNWKIGAKIFFGFGILIIIISAISAVVILSNTQIGQGVQEVDDASDLQTVAFDLYSDFSAARTNANILYNVISQEATQAFEDDAAAAAEQFPTMLDMTPDGSFLAEHDAMVSTTQAEFTQWVDKVHEVIATTDLMVGAMDELSAHSGEVASASQLLLDDQIQLLREDAADEEANFLRRADRLDQTDTISDAIATTRINIRHLLDSFDVSAAEETLASIDEAISLASKYRDESTIAQNVANAQTVVDVMTKIRELVVTYVDYCAQRNDLIAEAKSLGDVAMAHISDLFNDLDATMVANVDEVGVTVTGVQGLVGIVSGVSIALAILLLIIINRSITKPIKALVVVAEKVSKGVPPEENEVRALVSKNEVGQMAAAMQSIVDTLNRLLADISMLTDASVAGQLSTRADASIHEGAFNMMVGGINNILDAVIAPVMEASDVLGEMAKGNLSVEVTGDYQGDHAIIKNALNSSIDTLKGYVSEISDSLAAMADGDFTVEITRDYLGDFIALKDSINAIADSLSQVMTGINNAAEQVAAGTQQVSDGAQATSQGATEQASSIEELTATITQIAEQTRQNALNANDANQQSNTTKGFAQEGSALMDSMQNSMREINEASSSISSIIKVIDDISFKTNILALNAAVEAAHAGTHGKGFAVVAEQVRDLAGQSAQATQETTDLIESSIKKAETGTRLAEETGQSLVKIVTGVDKAGEVIGQIAVASNEQATGIAQINKGIEQLSQVVQTNSATAQEAAAAAEELSSQAELLKQMVARFRLKSEKNSFSAPKAAATPIEPVEESEFTSSAPPAQIVLSDNEFGKY